MSAKGHVREGGSPIAPRQLRHCVLVAIFCFLQVSIALHPLSAPCPTAVPASLEKNVNKTQKLTHK